MIVKRPNDVKSINLQIGTYSLCYKKLAIFRSPTTTYFVGGTQNFSQPTHHIFTARHVSPILHFSEEHLEIPIQSGNRKDEIINFLKSHYSDSGISFKMKAFGLLGLIKFTQGYYAVVIEEAEVIGTITEHEIYEVKRCKMLSLFSKSSEKKDERKYRDHMKKYLSNENPDFFFSYTYDLSKNLQDNFMFSLKDKQDFRVFYESEELPNFQWNGFLRRNFEKVNGGLESGKWVIRMMHGSFQQMKIQLYSNVLSFSLIGRRLTQNAGTRYNRRGLNEEVSKKE